MRVSANPFRSTVFAAWIRGDSVPEYTGMSGVMGWVRSMTVSEVPPIGSSLSWPGKSEAVRSIYRVRDEEPMDR
jgi:hypothetical protein